MPRSAAVVATLALLALLGPGAPENPSPLHAEERSIGWTCP
jgi:hypothetical protein